MALAVDPAHLLWEEEDEEGMYACLSVCATRAGVRVPSGRTPLVEC